MVYYSTILKHMINCENAVKQIENTKDALFLKKLQNQ